VKKSGPARIKGQWVEFRGAYVSHKRWEHLATRTHQCKTNLCSMLGRIPYGRTSLILLKCGSSKNTSMSNDPTLCIESEQDS